jgi:hypothetical protein
MKGRKWGAVLTGGLFIGALALVCLLGAVLRSTAQGLSADASLWKEGSGRRSAPARTRETDQDKANPQREHRPPIRLWRGPSPDRHPQKARKALA